MVRNPFKREKVRILTPEPDRDKWFTKDRLQDVLTQLKVQVEKLTRTSSRLSGRGKELFEQCVKAEQERDTSRASMYANEIAELRKMSRVILRSELSLEQVVLRLETVREFGDIMGVLAPAVSIVQQIQGELSGVVPEVAGGLARIDEMLDSLLVEAGTVTGQGPEVALRDEEAQKIMREASEVAAQRMKTAFPELPERYRHLEAGEERQP